MNEAIRDVIVKAMAPHVANIGTSESWLSSPGVVREALVLALARGSGSASETERLRKLVARWRHEADIAFTEENARGIRLCADSLEAALEPGQPSAGALDTYRCMQCGMVGTFPSPLWTPEEEAELAKLESKGVRWKQSAAPADAAPSGPPSGGHR